MLVHEIDNSLAKELDRVILWQYDGAEHLVGLLEMFKDFAQKSTEQFWDDWREEAFSIINESTEGKEDLRKLGLAVWGAMLGVKRTTWKTTDGNKQISDELYRTLLKARLALMLSNGTMPDYNNYVNAIFGEEKVTVASTGKMDLTFSKANGSDPSTWGGGSSPTELSRLFDDAAAWQIKPAGVDNNEWAEPYYVFGFEGQDNGRQNFDPQICSFVKDEDEDIEREPPFLKGCGPRFFGDDYKWWLEQNFPLSDSNNNDSQSSDTQPSAEEESEQSEEQ